MKLLKIVPALAAAILLTAVARAFPPAPHHTFYGLLRDEFGFPLNVSNAEIFLETSAGKLVKTFASPGLEPAINYRLAVPMDAAVKPDSYRPSALQPTVAFRIKVKIGNVTYLPMEMVADYSKLRLPGEATRINLTLGVDSDGDGLPDAWELALLSLSGASGGLGDIRPGDDTDGDGFSNLNEYYAGAYAFDPNNSLVLQPAGFRGVNPLLEFNAVEGRTYYLLQSADLRNWTPVKFRSGHAPALDRFQAIVSDIVEIEVVPETTPAGPVFFQLYVD